MKQADLYSDGTVAPESIEALREAVWLVCGVRPLAPERTENGCRFPLVVRTTDGGFALGRSERDALKRLIRMAVSE